jgi:hypothetical protein
MSDRLLVYLDARLDGMLARPRAWGSPEAFELQVLLLLEVRQVVVREAQRTGAVRDREYVQFLAERLPEHGCRALSATFSDHETIAEHLRAFRAWLST